jgi:hypothetical protein
MELHEDYSSNRDDVFSTLIDPIEAWIEFICMSADLKESSVILSL